MKNDIKQKFERIYKGCVLYAIHLDGFSHTVFYKDNNGEKHIDGCSFYAPEQYEASNKLANAWRSFNEDKTKVLFLGCNHSCYQNNAQEYIYKDVAEW